jgi:enoyl-CoA hydratase/carnithine racemase
MKRQLREADGETFEVAREKSSALAGLTLEAADFKEAMAAKREKREPQFKPVIADFAPSISKG